MPDPKADIFFPGLHTYSHVALTNSLGIAPAVITVETPDGASIEDLQATGNLELLYADRRLELQGCLVDDAFMQWSIQGWSWTIKILDRRWAWDLGVILGHYNLPTVGISEDSR